MGVCAVPSCFDGVHNQDELSTDCGAVCGNPITNTIVNGGFEMDAAGWTAVSPEFGNQGTYFGGNSSNRVVEVDANSSTTSSLEQDFAVTVDDVGQSREVALEVGDRSSESGDEGGLLVGITDPNGNAVPLTGVGGAGFSDVAENLLAVDALQSGSFVTAEVGFTPTMEGAHTLRLIEQTDGPGLGNGGGIIVDNVVVSMVQCP